MRFIAYDKMAKCEVSENVSGEHSHFEYSRCTVSLVFWFNVNSRMSIITFNAMSKSRPQSNSIPPNAFCITLASYMKVSLFKKDTNIG